VEDALTAHSTDSDITTLNALSHLLAEQIARLDEALDLVTDADVHDIIIRAQLTREDALDRIRGRIRHLGERPQPLPEEPPPTIGPEDVDNDEALDNLVDGENELCSQFQKSVDDQALMPRTRHFLRNILDRMVPSTPRAGMEWIH
jgi:hypothetical protein